MHLLVNQLVQIIQNWPSQQNTGFSRMCTSKCGTTYGAGPACEICAGHGEIADADKCTCNRGYTGRLCENCAVDYTRDTSGRCVLENS